ncbi:PIN-like domain-containing protein [Streptomyces sp. LN499]|uniref:PIN-like domain-containing protein n=1 Tax=Streptomyces sp. LN499 TaxID=3112977 RepID=UPI0037210258
MSDDAQHSSLFDGFEGYRTPTMEDYRRVMTQGMVVLDTSILLNLYRYDRQTRRDLLSVLNRIQSQLWVPHQAIAEFWANRDLVLTSRRDSARRALTSLESPARSTVEAVELWARNIGLDDVTRHSLITDISDAYVQLRKSIADHRIDTEIDSIPDTGEDPVIRALETILSGRVGQALPPSDHEQALKEATRRAQDRVPPGYMDQHKENNRGAGDYLLWEQTLREAQNRATDVLLVTQDMKEDWWRQTRGVIRGPRPELTREIKVRAGCDLFMMQPQGLLQMGQEVLSVHVDEASVQQVKRFEWMPTAFIDPPTPGSFTLPEGQRLGAERGEKSASRKDAS